MQTIFHTNVLFPIIIERGATISSIKKAIIVNKISIHFPTFISTSIPRDEINRTKKKSLGSHRS